ARAARLGEHQLGIENGVVCVQFERDLSAEILKASIFEPAPRHELRLEPANGSRSAAAMIPPPRTPGRCRSSARTANRSMLFDELRSGSVTAHATGVNRCCGSLGLLSPTSFPSGSCTIA